MDNEMEVFNFEPSGLANDRPDLVFEEGSYSIAELLDSHLLPVVVQYDTARQPLPSTDFNFDLTQPLLIYKKRNIQKVAARSLCVEDGQYREVGESLLIPEDYKGWFAVLQRVTGSHAADDNVPHFTSIEEIANSNTEKFLVGGTRRINGLQINDERSESRLTQEPRIFLPGDVMTREKLYYGETQKKTRFFRKPKYITEKFLMCRDESDREVLLPFEQTGIFYQVSHKGGKATKNVLQMSDIVARKLTARFIKLVFGRFPVTPSSFTGLMKAESSGIETSVIASTIIHKKNVLMEMPVTSDTYFRIALTNDDLRRNPCFLNAKSLCAEKASTYMRNIKVCYNFVSGEDGSPGDNMPQIYNNRLSSSTLSSTHSQTFMADCGGVLDNASDTLSDTAKMFNERMADKEDVLLRHQYNLSPYRMSEDYTPNVMMRPAKTLSTSRMSFCLGNSYLTIPVFDRILSGKRDSGNNNTNPVTAFTTKRGSVNDTVIEEAESSSEAGVMETSNDANDSSLLSCTNIGAYVNAVAPPELSADAPFTDYRPVATSRRPSTKAPGAAPPPLPNSCSTSGVSSGSSSSASEDAASKRGSTSSFEYAVPKIEDASVIRSNLSESTSTDQSKLRRPSTFTFSEGCFQANSSFTGLGFPSIKDVEEEPDDVAAGGAENPVYENIRTLMEIVTKLENKDEGDGQETLSVDSCENGADKALQDSNDKERSVCLPSNSGLVTSDDNNEHVDDINDTNIMTNTIEVPDIADEQSSESDTNELLEELRIVEQEIWNTCNIGPDENVGTDVNRETLGGNNLLDESEVADGTETTQGVHEESLWNIVVSKGKRDGPSRKFLQEAEKHFSVLDVAELTSILRAIGIKEDSISVIREKHIHGQTLAEVLNCDNVELALRECLRGVHLVDQQKISMFIRGWRPDNDG